MNVLEHWIATNPPRPDEYTVGWEPKALSSERDAETYRRLGWQVVEVVPADQLRGAVARADAAEGRISLAEHRLQFAFQRAGIEVDAQGLEGFVKYAAQHVERGR